MPDLHLILGVPGLDRFYPHRLPALQALQAAALCFDLGLPIRSVQGRRDRVPLSCAGVEHPNRLAQAQLMEKLALPVVNVFGEPVAVGVAVGGVVDEGEVQVRQGDDDLVEGLKPGGGAKVRLREGLRKGALK